MYWNDFNTFSCFLLYILYYLVYNTNEILQKFRYLLKLKSKGVNLFFTDIDKIKDIMLKEK